MFHILTSNEKATLKYLPISQEYIEYTFTEDYCDFMNTKDKHYIDFISFDVKCQNGYTHAHFQTVLKWAFSESKFAGLAWLLYQR